MLKPHEVLLLANAADGDAVLLHATGEPAEMLLEAEGADGKGRLPTFAMNAYNGGPIEPGGWFSVWASDHYHRPYAPVIIDLAGMDIAQQVPIDSGHAEDVGHSTAVEKSPGNMKLKARGVLSAFTPDAAEQDPSAQSARRIVRMGAAGFPFQASIAPSIDRRKVDFVAAGDSVKVNGRNHSGPVYVARQSTLKKIAILSLGADSSTSTTVAAQYQKGQQMEFQAWLKASGFDPAKLSEQETATLRAAWEKQKPVIPTPTPPAIPPAPAVQDPAPVVTAAIANERRRIADINAAIEGITLSDAGRTQMAALHARAINAEIDLATLNAGLIGLIRAERAAPVNHADAQGVTCTLEALQGAVMLRAGIALDNRHFGTPQAIAMGLPGWTRAALNSDTRQRVLEAAHEFSGLSMIDLARTCLRLDGRPVPNSRESLIQASFSSGTLLNIFTTNVNTVVLSRYMESGDTSGAWTRTTDVSDFKSNERPRLEKGGGGLKKLGRGGKADHRKFSDKAETYKIARYSEQFTIDEQDYIDDSFRAFDVVAPDMADDAARLRPDMVYAHLMSNPTLAATDRELFNATDANLATTTALTAANLKAGLTAMNLIRENSVNIDVTPTHYIGPPTLDFLVRELLHSGTIVMTTTADVQRGSKNTLEGLVTPISEKRLENGVTDPASGSANTSYSGSSSTWYLASTKVHTIEVAYLKGTGRAPVIRSYTLDKGEYGFGFDIKLDIGCKALDWRGLRKHTA